MIIHEAPSLDGAGGLVSFWSDYFWCPLWSMMGFMVGMADLGFELDYIWK